MTHIDRVLAMALSVILVSGCASIQSIDSSKMDVIPVTGLLSEPERYTPILVSSVQEKKDLIFFIEEGQSVPMKALIVLPMAEHRSSDNQILFRQDTYLLVSQSKIMVSPDGQRWADLNDAKAHKTLYGLSKGFLSIGFHVTKADGPHFTVHMGSK